MWWRGELRCLIQWEQLYTEALINFGDLTQYLNYDNTDLIVSLKKIAFLDFKNASNCVPIFDQAQTQFFTIFLKEGRLKWEATDSVKQIEHQNLVPQNRQSVL